MSTPLLTQIDRQVSYSVDINIPQRLHQQPVLANLIGNYDLTINFRAAVLDRKATGGGWFNLSLEGDLQDIEQTLCYLRDLEIEIFPRGLVPIAISSENNFEKKQQAPKIDRLVTDYDL